MRTNFRLQILVAGATLAAFSAGMRELCAAPHVQGGAATAKAQVIPFHQTKIDQQGPHWQRDLAFPVFDHPRPGARAALAALVDHAVESFVNYTPASGSAGHAQLDCEVVTASTSLESFVCRSMITENGIADSEQGIGGAPAEPSIWTMLLLVDGDAVREGTLGDVFANPKRAQAQVLARVEARISDSCTGVKLDRSAAIDAFTLSEEGVTFYFPMSAFELTSESAGSCDREIGFSRSELRGLLRRGSALERLSKR